MARKPRSKSESDVAEKDRPMTVEERIENLQVELEDVNMTMSVQARDLTSIRARVEQLKSEMEEIAEGASAEDLARVESALSAIEGRLQDVESSLISRTADTESVREDIGKNAADIAQLQKQVAEQEQQSGEKLAALETSAKESQSSLEERLGILKEELSQSSELVKAEDFTRAGAETQERFAALTMENESLREELAKLRGEVGEVAQAKGVDFSELQKNVQDIKASLDGAEELSSKAKEALVLVNSLEEQLNSAKAQLETITAAAAAGEKQVDTNLEALKMAMRLVEQLDEKVRQVTAASSAVTAAPTAAGAATTLSRPIIEPLEEDEAVVAEVGEELGYDLGDILRVVVNHGASDLHLKSGTPPTVRLNGDLVPVGNQNLSPEDSRALVYSAMSKAQRAQLADGREVDFAYASDGARFRVNAFLERGNVSAAFRMLRTELPSIDSLGLPPVIKTLASMNSGLILVTGPAGSGKSTTLAAVVDYINTTRKCHVVTVEDPIEFFHSDKMSIITQREVGTDTADFGEALKMSLRQDPNVIMVGEMRDAETIMTAVVAAETGHLVLSTLHTPNAVQAVDRIIDTFSGDLQRQFRLLLSNSLRGVVSQKLLSRADEKGRVAAVEAMVVTPTISSLILEGKTQDIYPYIQQGANDGMQTFSQSLLSLYSQGLISKEEGLFHADQPTEFRMGVEGHASSAANTVDIADETLMNWL